MGQAFLKNIRDNQQRVKLGQIRATYGISTWCFLAEYSGFPHMTYSSIFAVIAATGADLAKYLIGVFRPIDNEVGFRECLRYSIVWGRMFADREGRDRGGRIETVKLSVIRVEVNYSAILSKHQTLVARYFT